MIWSSCEKREKISQGVGAEKFSKKHPQIVLWGKIHLQNYLSKHRTLKRVKTRKAIKLRIWSIKTTFSILNITIGHWTKVIEIQENYNICIAKCEKDLTQGPRLLVQNTPLGVIACLLLWKIFLALFQNIKNTIRDGGGSNSSMHAFIYLSHYIKSLSCLWLSN